MTIDEYPQETIGMIRARRWAEWAPWILAGLIGGAVGWQAALVFAAVAITIRLEVKRVLVTIWPESSHAVRRALEDRDLG